MDTKALKDDLFFLVAYMLTSARGLYEEPPDYGIFRLLDASGRLLEIMEDHGLSDPFLAQLKDVVDGERDGSMDNQRQRQRLEACVQDIAKEMKQRLS